MENYSIIIFQDGKWFDQYLRLKDEKTALSKFYELCDNFYSLKDTNVVEERTFILMLNGENIRKINIKFEL